MGGLTARKVVWVCQGCELVSPKCAFRPIVLNVWGVES